MEKRKIEKEEKQKNIKGFKRKRKIKKLKKDESKQEEFGERPLGRIILYFLRIQNDVSFFVFGTNLSSNLQIAYRELLQREATIETSFWPGKGLDFNFEKLYEHILMCDLA